MQFKCIAKINKRNGGLRKVYEVQMPSGIEYFCADYAWTFDRGPETMVFRCDETGYVSDWGDLWEGPGDAVTNNQAITEYLKYALIRLDSGDDVCQE